MKLWQTFIYGIVISFVLANIAACSDKTESLTLVATVPGESDDIYIGMAIDFTVDNQHNIWICDQGTNRIHQFDAEFRYVKSIGDLPGQGPAEFMGPTFISVNDEELFVTDMSNRVQILGKDGIYKASFSKESHGFGITAFDSTCVIGSVKLDEITTMAAYERGGKLIKRFGALYEGSENCNLLLNLGRVHVSNNKIYFVYMYFPEMRIYDLAYRLVAKTGFDYKRYKKLSQDNIKFNYIGTNPARFNECKLLFTASDVTSLGVFLVARGKDICIDQFDFDGTLVQQYVYEKGEFAIGGMHVEEMPNGGLRFYLLGSDISDYIPVVKVFDYIG
ncbi:hypothetical protein JXO52_10440 [bacterium]|nr:hypothetical protein [bacterium]